MEQSYNTKEGIESYLNSLEGFNQLAADVRAAGYERHERLDEFYLFGGRFSIDACGNFNKWEDQLTEDAYERAPRVMTKTEYLEFFAAEKARGSMKDPDQSFISGSNLLEPQLPPARIVDPVNGRGWTIEDCHEFRVVSDYEEIDLNAYTGMSWAEAKLELQQSTDCLYYFFEQPEILNELHVDLSPDPEFPEEPINSDGVCRDAKDDSYRIRPGDRTMVQTARFYHNDTYTQYLEQERQRCLQEYTAVIQELFEASGFTDVVVTPRTLPPHVLAFMKDEFDDVHELQEFEATCPWYEVAAAEGQLGVGVFGEEIPWIDLTSAGVSLHALAAELDQPLPPDEVELEGALLLPLVDLNLISAICRQLKDGSSAEE